MSSTNSPKLYEEWLYFFYSPSIKVKKNGEDIEKKYLDDGKMEIIGKKPNNWSVQIIPLKTINIRKLKYDLELAKNNLRHQIEQSFQDGNKDLFLEIKKEIIKNDKKLSEIEKILEINQTKIRDSIQNTFDARRELFIETLKDKSDKKKIKSLSENLEKKIMEEIKILKEVKKQESNFIIRKQELIQKGPVPAVPKTEELSVKGQRKKVVFDKTMDTSKQKGGYSNSYVLEHNCDKLEKNNYFEKQDDDDLKIIYI